MLSGAPKSNRKGNGWGPEDHEQFKLVQWLKLQYPHVLFIHVPNESKRSAVGYKKMKALGVMRGVSDILIFDEADHNHGLAIEMKSKDGRVRQSQSLFLAAIGARKWKTAVCWSFEEAVSVVNEYFKNEK